VTKKLDLVVFVDQLDHEARSPCIGVFASGTEAGRRSPDS
jgi:hypothetical protein